MPFHRIEAWNGAFFAPLRSSSPQLHQSLYLGHSGDPCQAGYTAAHWNRPMESTLTVLHTNGYHKLRAVYCNCIGSPEPHAQLTQAGIFPSTQIRPATGFTFQLLRQFHHQNIASKTSVHDFHKALICVTDNVLPQAIPVGVRHPRATLQLLKSSLECISSLGCSDPSVEDDNCLSSCRKATLRQIGTGCAGGAVPCLPRPSNQPSQRLGGKPTKVSSLNCLHLRTTS